MWSWPSFILLFPYIKTFQLCTLYFKPVALCCRWLPYDCRMSSSAQLCLCFPVCILATAARQEANMNVKFPSCASLLSEITVFHYLLSIALEQLSHLFCSVLFCSVPVVLLRPCVQILLTHHHFNDRQNNYNESLFSFWSK